MIVIPGRIPILIHPFFWVLAALLGLLYGGLTIYGLLWVGVVFVSVLFHELGHALTALGFRQHPQIALVALGGITTYEGKNLKIYQQFLIALNGPVFGFLLFGISYYILSLQFFQNPLLIYFFTVLQSINLFWSIINLVPIIPLDGGQLMRIVLEGLFGMKGFRAALFVSMMIAFGLSLVCFIFFSHAMILGIILFLFAFQNFEIFRKSSFISISDRDEQNKNELLLAEKTIQKGDKSKAKELFQKVREDTKEGLLFTTATQSLAFLLSEEGEKKKAYELLLSIKDRLSSDAVLVLHELAFEFNNFDLVVELSSTCYQTFPLQDVALRNAKAFAYLHKPKPAGGWLATALEFGKLDIEKILKESVFQSMLKDSTFKAFIKNLVDEK